MCNTGYQILVEVGRSALVGQRSVAVLKTCHNFDEDREGWIELSDAKLSWLHCAFERFSYRQGPADDFLLDELYKELARRLKES